MINALRNHLDANRAAFGLSEQAALRVELRAPWRQSCLSRCHFFVRHAGETVPRLVVTDAMPLYGPSAPLSLPPLASPFMPAGGTFELEGAVYGWSRFVDAPSLLDCLGDRPQQHGLALISRFATCLAADQGERAVDAPLPLAALQEQCLARMASPKVGARFLVFAGQAALLADADRPRRCSWSHGDLWPPDVFVEKDRFLMVDWEWATPAAPLGADLVDLHVTLAEHWLAVPTVAAWRSLVAPEAGFPAPVREVLDTVVRGRDKLEAVLYALVRAVGRVLAQDGLAGMPQVENYEAVLQSLGQEA